MSARACSQLLADLDALGLIAWSAEPDTWSLTGATAAARALLGVFGALPTWLELVHPDDRPALLGSRVAATLDQRLRGPDASWQWVRVELRRAGDEFLAVATPTDGLRAAAGRTAQAYFDALIENIPFDFFEMDSSGAYVRLNAQARKVWGDQSGRRLEDLDVAESTREIWRANNVRAFGGEVVNEEVELILGGERRQFINLIAPVKLEGAIRGIVGINIDLTAHRQAEQRTEKLAGELKKSLAALDEAQLRLVSRERLAALGELAAVVAHEVRNPLGAIFNAINQIRKHLQAGDTVAELLSIIDEEATRLDAMVTNLLSYARPIHPFRVAEPLEAILRHALHASLRAQEPPVPIDYTIEVAPELGPVPVDAQLLRMALTNIFTNAVQAMPGGGKLTITAGPEARDGATWAEVKIRDNGRGIPAEHLPRIFEPFFTTRAAGTGLGLAVVRRIVEAHQGAVVAHSEPGQGATFALYLPR